MVVLSRSTRLTLSCFLSFFLPAADDAAAADDDSADDDDVVGVVGGGTKASLFRHPPAKRRPGRFLCLKETCTAWPSLLIYTIK